MRITSKRFAAIVTAVTAALALAGCSNSGSDTAASGENESNKSFTIGINQLVQHPALDAAAAGFKRAFAEAGYVEGQNVTFDEQNANGEQSTALTISQNFATQNLDMVYAIATPAAQASARTITDIPVLFSAVTDPEAAGLVESNEKPGANITGTSDLASIADQLDLLLEIVPEAKKVGIVYASGEVNSEVQVEAAKEAAAERNIDIVTQTVSSSNEISQATEALGSVDAIYVPTDNMIVAGIASVVSVAEAKQIPVIGAEPGTVEGGAVATLGIDYEALGFQTGKQALKILEDGQDPATTPVEFAKEFTYVVNKAAAERMGVTVPEAILEQAEIVE